MKKLLLTGLAVFLFPALALATFPDVPASSPFYDAINFAQTQQIVKGYPDGTFKPDNYVNRAEFIKIIIGAAYPDAIVNLSASFENCKGARKITNTGSYLDVDDGAWYAPYVCIATLNTIVSGYSDGSFKPGQYTNLAEAAKIMFRGFNRVATIKAVLWYRPYVEYFERIAAIPVSLLDADQKISRGEMAEIMYRVINDIETKPSSTIFFRPGDLDTYGITLDVILPQTSFEVGDTITGGRYYMEYAGKPFRGFVTYKNSLAGNTHYGFRYTQPTIIENIDFDVPGMDAGLNIIPSISPFKLQVDEAFTINTVDFEQAGKYKYKMAVFSCDDVKAYLNFDCDSTWTTFPDSDSLVLLPPIVTTHKEVTVIDKVGVKRTEPGSQEGF